MKPKGKRVKHSPYINFSEWNLTAKQELSEAFENIFERCLAEACEVATEEREPNIYFPHVYNSGKKPSDGFGGKCPDDPTTIYVQLPLGDDEDEGPMWSLKFSELIDWIVKFNADDDETEIVCEDQVKQVREIVEGLRKQIERLEAALIAGELT